ncbi:MAG: DUF2797 domain-containing protein [Flavobacteriaceae bacterium]|jgi:hypothetical protein|nr:DUF2797 domain-containing protein [Flavobacteriaceae bacterium]
MKITGLLTKMITENSNPIQYYLNFDDEFIIINQLLKKSIKIRFKHYQCLGCGRDKEIFAMGYCKNCYFTSPHAGEWVVRPELSTAHLGKADRDLEFESQAQLQPHIVYLANTGGVKVGVTRKSQIPTRWIDQGAEYAIKLAETENRYEAGLIEVALKEHIADKTNFRKMLNEKAPFIDLSMKKNELLDFIPKELQYSILEDNQIIPLYYPIHSYPLMVNSVNLKKNPEFEGVLIGIKGQYLMFDNNLVFNVRNHEGFVVELDIQ